MLPRALRDRPVALRMSSTLLLVVLAVGVPLTLQRLSLFHAVHYAIAAGYLFAALVRLPYACGSIESLPDAVRSLVMLACKAYDYLTGERRATWIGRLGRLYPLERGELAYRRLVSFKPITVCGHPRVPVYRWTTHRPVLGAKCDANYEVPAEPRAALGYVQPG